MITSFGDLTSRKLDDAVSLRYAFLFWQSTEKRLGKEVLKTLLSNELYVPSVMNFLGTLCRVDMSLVKRDKVLAVIRD